MLLTEEQLCSLHRVQLNMLLDIDRVCSQNGVEYFLDSGTMLGAMRHGGFIPWDDDVDIAMPRDSYNRFIAIAQKELGPEYFVQNRATESEAPFSFTKIRLNNTEMIEEIISRSPIHQGIWVDVFPFDAIVNEPRALKNKELKWRFWHRLLTIRATEYSIPGTKPIKRIIRRILSHILKPVSIDWLVSKLDSLADDVTSSENSVFVCFHYFSKLVLMSENELRPFIRTQFEGHLLPVPNRWDLYLKRTYGAWEKMPPVEARHSHHISKLTFKD